VFGLIFAPPHIQNLLLLRFEGFGSLTPLQTFCREERPPIAPDQALLLSYATNFPKSPLSLANPAPRQKTMRTLLSVPLSAVPSTRSSLVYLTPLYNHSFSPFGFLLPLRSSSRKLRVVSKLITTISGMNQHEFSLRLRLLLFAGPFSSHSLVSTSPWFYVFRFPSQAKALTQPLYE